MKQVWAGCMGCVLLLFGVGAEARVMTFTYRVEIAPVALEGGDVDIRIPLAARDDRQRVLSERIEAPFPGEERREASYGNRYWFARVPAWSLREGASVTIVTTVDRRPHVREVPASAGALSDEEAAAHARYLGANQLVPVGHTILEPIRAEIHSALDSDDPAAVARGIYDWVVDNIEYRKVGTGWGNGDTFWACTAKYGNCTDFHALFISLARTEGIPARFEIGFPIPQDRLRGEVKGYHCWVEFYLPGSGWVPIDASEAAKHPEQREFLYGSQAEDRLLFTRGRDLVLDDEQRSGPLNYFVYPFLERDGRRYEGEVSSSFFFEEASAGETASRSEPSRS